MRILLAEDDPHISIITQLCLEKMGGHEVVVRGDGDAALQLALREPFDLIMLDGMMPKKSGRQVATELQSAGVVGTPIIFLSATNSDEEVAAFMKIGVGHIAKPFDPQTICQAIDKILLKAGAPPK